MTNPTPITNWRELPRIVRIQPCEEQDAVDLSPLFTQYVNMREALVRIANLHDKLGFHDPELMGKIAKEALPDA